MRMPTGSKMPEQDVPAEVWRLYGYGIDPDEIAIMVGVHATKVRDIITRQRAGDAGARNGAVGPAGSRGEATPPTTSTRRTTSPTEPNVNDSAIGPQPVAVTLADVEPVTVTWLWEGRIPAGKLVVLDGDPSLGKSTLSLTMAAHISTGRAWPDASACPVGDVVILSAEDGMADTVRPRLDAAGGDPARVHALTAVEFMDSGGTVSTRLPTLDDLDVIDHLIRSTSARLVIVDVLMAYLPEKKKSSSDQDMRSVLHRYATLAEATGCTVLVLRHLRKSEAGNPLYRGGGSIGIIGAARAGMVVAPDPDAEEGDDRRVLAWTKSNLAKMPPSLAYRLVSAPGSHVARVDWCGESEHGAAALLSAAPDSQPGERDEAVAWLLDYLESHGGEAIAGQVIGAGAKAGIAKRTLQNARKRAGVVTRKGSMGGGWVWAIPVEGATETVEGAEDARAQSASTFGTFDAPSALHLATDADLFERAPASRPDGMRPS